MVLSITLGSQDHTTWHQERIRRRLVDWHRGMYLYSYAATQQSQSIIKLHAGNARMRLHSAFGGVSPALTPEMLIGSAFLLTSS
jgi:hypothetical protein